MSTAYARQAFVKVVRRASGGGLAGERLRTGGIRGPRLTVDSHILEDQKILNRNGSGWESSRRQTN